MPIHEAILLGIACGTFLFTLKFLADRGWLQILMQYFLFGSSFYFVVYVLSTIPLTKF